MPAPLSWPLSTPPPAPSGLSSGRSSLVSLALRTPDFGLDFTTYPDLDWGVAISGPQAVLESAARSLEDSRFGVDLRGWLNRALGAADLNDLEQVVVANVQGDERVAAASVQASQTGTALSLEVEIVLVDEESPLRLVLAVTSLGLELLKESAL